MRGPATNYEYECSIVLNYAVCKSQIWPMSLYVYHRVQIKLLVTGPKCSILKLFLARLTEVVYKFGAKEIKLTSTFFFLILEVTQKWILI